MNPLVSLVIVCRNEERFIAACLDSAFAQTYPKEAIEILVVDGNSQDATREVIKEYAQKDSRITLHQNPKNIFAAGANVGIKQARGEFIVLWGAHAAYSGNYIEQCVSFLQAHKEIVCAGGALAPRPAANTLVAKAIAFAAGGRFGRGRERVEGVPQQVDTVFAGCYRKEIFEKVGLHDERLRRSADMDLSLRIAKAGRKIYALPEAFAFYYPKVRLKAFFLHNIKDGVWAVLPFWITGRAFKSRHYLPLVFMLALPVSIWLYIPAVLLFSAKIAISEKSLALLFVMPLAFFCRHFGYGFGSVIGLAAAIWRKEQ